MCGMKWLPRRLRTVALSGDAQALLRAAAERARTYAHDYIGVEHVFLSAWALPDKTRATPRLHPIVNHL